jgi:hypothetical protein
MTRSIAASPAAAMLLALALFAAACARQEPESRATAAERAACSQHADEVFRLRNPDVIYRQDTYVSSTRDTPFNGAGLSSVPSAGLSGKFERDQLLDDCINGGGQGTTGAPPMPEETPPARPTGASPAQP